MIRALREAGAVIPATAKLLYRLVRDERIDERRRVGLVIAVGYALLPIDLIPDRLPFLGRVDDVVIGAAALQALLTAAGDEIVHEHWDGSPGSLEALLTGVELVAGLMPRPVRRLLGVVR